MPLKHFKSWPNLDTSFKLNQTIEVKQGTINVDYVVFNENNEIIIFGFDLPDNSISENGIISFLYNEKTNLEKNSILYRLLNVIENESNPFVFLSTGKKVFYLPNGVRQINSEIWKTLEHPNELIRIWNEQQKRLK